MSDDCKRYWTLDEMIATCDVVMASLRQRLDEAMLALHEVRCGARCAHQICREAAEAENTRLRAILRRLTESVAAMTEHLPEGEYSFLGAVRIDLREARATLRPEDKK